MFHHQLRILGLGIQTGADRRAADPEVAQSVRRLGDAVSVSFDGAAVGRELLSEADGRRVLEMRTSGLEDLVERLPLRQKGARQLAHRLE